MERFSDLSLTAQTAYAELLDQALHFDLTGHVGNLHGSFQKKSVKDRDYWYFAWRDLNGKVQQLYVGPDSERVRKLLDDFERARQPENRLVELSRSLLALGGHETLLKHFKIIRRLAEYGLFKAGGVLIGTHAFLAMGNMLGVRWGAGQLTHDVDFAHSGKRLSVALPSTLKVDMHDALTSLEMGFLPISTLESEIGAQYRNPSDPELRVDFVAPEHRRAGKAITSDSLNIALQPLKFMEFSLEEVSQSLIVSRQGPVVVNLPHPARYAVHKLIVYGERPVRERTKAVKDLQQAACLANYYLAHEPDIFAAAWLDAVGRGAGWKKRAISGQAALLKLAPELDAPSLWG